MLYVTFETTKDNETTILGEKSTILDGRRRRRGNVELKPPQPELGNIHSKGNLPNRLRLH